MAPPYIIMIMLQPSIYFLMHKVLRLVQLRPYHYLLLVLLLPHNCTLNNAITLCIMICCSVCMWSSSLSQTKSILLHCMGVCRHTCIKYIDVPRRPSGTPGADCVEAEGVVVRQEVIPRFQEESKQVMHCFHDCVLY